MVADRFGRPSQLILDSAAFSFSLVPPRLPYWFVLLSNATSLIMGSVAVTWALTIHLYSSRVIPQGVKEWSDKGSFVQHGTCLLSRAASNTRALGKS